MLILPANVTVTVPVLLMFAERSLRPVPAGPAVLLTVVGASLALAGLTLLVTTVCLFYQQGRGTLAPWDPTSRLVVSGPYRHVRNPMLSGVMLVLFGEALLARSLFVLGWLGGFALVNHIYIVRVEEPGLAKRFGAEYERYKREVPRWLPGRGSDAGSTG